MTRFILPILAVAFLAAGIVATPSALAQTASPSPTQQQAVGDTEIKAFAEAVKEVRAIREEYAPQLAQARSPDEQKAVQQEATEKMVAAIEEKGLSVAKFNQIADVAQKDPKTAGKINEHLR